MKNQLTSVKKILDKSMIHSVLATIWQSWKNLILTNINMGAKMQVF